MNERRKMKVNCRFCHAAVGDLVIRAHGSTICEKSGALDVAFQSRQLSCGRGTCGFSAQLRSSTLQGRCALM